MLCVTIARTKHKSAIAEHLQVAEQGAKLVELRLDYIGRSIDLARLLKNRPTPVVVTCRRKADGGRWDRTEEERLMLIRSAISMGIEYVDLEEDIAAKIPRYGKTKRIISLHDFDGMPKNLDAVHAGLAKHDADIVKIAVQGNSFKDTIRMLQLMQTAAVPTIGISMGDYGIPTRILATRYGAPFTYCVYDTERAVAPGQLSFDQMKNVYRADSIDAETKIFGVVGDPIAQSYSPLVHNASFLANKLNYRYIPFRISAEELELFLSWCKEEKIGGLSVTIPHKQTILHMLDQAESGAQGIGACNTVVFASLDKEVIGYNTDFRGAMDCLSEAMTNWTGKKDPFENETVLILGAGGVARAIGYGLSQRRAEVTITSRSNEKAESLSKHINGNWIDWGDRHLFEAKILINCTPVGMFPDMDASPFIMSTLKGNTLVFDTVYNPEQTLFLKGAKLAGCPVVSGLQMFARQAAYQYRLFTGLEPPIDVMVKTLKKAISPVNYKEVEEEGADD